MREEYINIKERKCRIYFKDENPEFLIIEAVDERDLKDISKQTDIIDASIDRSYIHVAFAVKEWNKELSPWEAPAVFGKEGFGDGAADTLKYITESLLPEIRERYDIKDDIYMIIGGYSLAGLFSLWVVYSTDIFKACAAASPSVWFPGWMDFAKSHDPLAEKVYLSLGDKEEKVRNPLMSKVGENIRNMYDLIKKYGTECILEWNEGNHFKDADVRCAKAFISCFSNNILI